MLLSIGSSTSIRSSAALFIRRHKTQAPSASLSSTSRTWRTRPFSCLPCSYRYLPHCSVSRLLLSRFDAHSIRFVDLLRHPYTCRHQRHADHGDHQHARRHATKDGAGAPASVNAKRHREEYERERDQDAQTNRPQNGQQVFLEVEHGNTIPKLPESCASCSATGVPVSPGSAVIPADSATHEVVSASTLPSFDP